MKIGDKVYFNKHLALDPSGKVKRTYQRVVIQDINPFNDAIIHQERNMLVSGWEKNLVDNTVEYKIREIPIKLTSGIYIGSFRKKLCRCYSRSQDSRTRRRDFLNERGVVTGTGRHILRNTRTTSLDNPFRLDNPYELDEVAIIATSKTKRYTISMKSLLECNFSNKFKVI